MAPKLPIKPRWVVGLAAIIVVAALMVTDTVQPQAGLPILVALLAGLGLYGRRQKQGGGGGGGG